MSKLHDAFLSVVCLWHSATSFVSMKVYVFVVISDVLVRVELIVASSIFSMLIPRLWKTLHINSHLFHTLTICKNLNFSVIKKCIDAFTQGVAHTRFPRKKMTYPRNIKSSR